MAIKYDRGKNKFFSFADYNANELKYGKTMGNQNALHTPSLYADHLFLLLCEYIAQIFIFLSLGDARAPFMT